MRTPFLSILSIVGLSVAVAGAACSIVGPAELRNGRSTYNDTIIATNSQQVLATIVRMRYGEPTGLLAVSSVTATVRFEANAGAQFGVGPENNYAGNLVPLSAGVVYEENPTISYAPVQSKEHLRLLLSPLPLDLTMLLLGATKDSSRTMTLFIRSVNGINNPDFLVDPATEVDPRFARVAELLGAMDRRGWLNWAEESEKPETFALVLQGDGDAYVKDMAELHTLLGLRQPGEVRQPVIIPVRLGIGGRDASGDNTIWLSTRSLYDLLYVAAAAVEVPDEHLESGLAQRLPPTGPAGRGICFRRSKSPPKEAMVAVQHHGWWYSVDGTDSATKETFRLLDALLSVRMTDALDNGVEAPVLTVPVR